MKANLIATLLIAALPIAFTYAEDKVAEEAKPAAEEGAEKKEEEKFDAEVKITGNIAMKFDKEAFTVETGKKVKLTLKNISTFPKVAGGHNLVILKSGVNAQSFAIACMSAAQSEYIAAAKKTDILAMTKMLGPNEEHSIIFEAPAPGKYDYICTFPGHSTVMRGKMTVK